MSQASTQSSDAMARGPAKPGAWRVRFVASENIRGARVIARLDDPEAAIAVAEPAAIPERFEVSDAASESEELLVVVRGRGQSVADNVGETSEKSGQSPRASMNLDGGRIQWCPGRATVEGPESFCEQALASLARFAFYEMQLRKLEAELITHEATAPADAALAFRPRWRHRANWKRLSKALQAIALMRLRFARLEPRLLDRSPGQTSGEWQIISQLGRAALVESRLEAVTNRLEACEDLYEGAIDRITDYRWYVRGALLEITIIILLLAEVVLIARDIFFAKMGR